MLQELKTFRGEALTETPWTIYPRPQMKRDSYLNLNGTWDFSHEDGEHFTAITLPFCPESALSGVKAHFDEGSILTYRRRFSLPEGFHRGRVLLHIGAADQHAMVYVNQCLVGQHDGGYEAFSFDITHVLQQENELKILCWDDLNDTKQPYGKQVLPKKRGGMWYTPVSGIWQTVWLESVPETYVQKLNIENRGYGVTISTVPALDGRVKVDGLGEYQLENGTVTITPENPRLWSPENPYLYEFTVEAGEDKVESYFAIRCLEIQKVGEWPRLCLNGKPYFFHGLLDQGYWPDGLFTPAAPECYADDILAMKKLGFNMLRKHIKVEPEEFYYQCDKLGMVVFQDMVNNGVYNFIRDTGLPTVSRLSQKLLPDRNLNKDPGTRKCFLQSMEKTVAQLKNHPCIVYWTIFNEGWGQFEADEAYEILRKLDDTRWIDSTSGWFRQKKTDVDSRHVYFRKLKGKGDGKKPLVLSEFGGYSCKIMEHSFNQDQTYGYGKFTDLEAFANAVEELYREQVLPMVRDGLCAAVYTQVSDVEDETNGLLTYDRKREKLAAAPMRLIAQTLMDAVRE